MESKIEELLKQLTLDEKISMIHGNGLFQTCGVERLEIPPLKMSDGPMGVRQEFENDHWITAGKSDDFVTYLPCNSAIASSWNREIAYQCGQVLGEEARGRGKDVILAPGVNIKRSPLCGRNFEYMSEDPFLTAETAVPFIKGIQESDVAACVKHFALNNQETQRLNVEVEVSERALREIYLPAFKKAVTEGKSKSVMGAYNRFKNAYCCESKLLLNQILREEWKFDGLVVSDWGAVHNTKEAAQCGLDVEMSVTDNFDEYYMAEPLKKAVMSGKIKESVIDEKVRNILRLMVRLHMLGDTKRKPGCYNTQKHRNTVLEAARESVILLKNEDQILPWKKEKIKRLLVIGDNAVRVHSNGGGSAEIKALYEITPLMGIKKLLGGNAQVDWIPGYLLDDYEEKEKELNWQADSLETQTKESKEERKEKEEERLHLKQEALKAVNQYEKVIFVGGLNHNHDSEGHDRLDMKLPYCQDELLKDLLKVNPNIVIVMMAGSPVEMSEWIHQAKTLIWYWYSGMEGGTALSDVIFGNVNPSGRLPETIPVTHRDCSAHSIGEYPGSKTVAYKEGIFVGYRHYDTHGIHVLFPFGYGLSYTQFQYDNLQIKYNNTENRNKENGIITVLLTVENVGSREGKEVVQLYIGKKNSDVDRPNKELKDFQKIFLKPKESKTVLFQLHEEDFGIYKEEQGFFAVESGEYLIMVGKSVKDICLVGCININR